MTAECLRESSWYHLVLHPSVQESKISRDDVRPKCRSIEDAESRFPCSMGGARPGNENESAFYFLTTSEFVLCFVCPRRVSVSISTNQHSTSRTAAPLAFPQCPAASRSRPSCGFGPPSSLNNQMEASLSTLRLQFRSSIPAIPSNPSASSTSPCTGLPHPKRTSGTETYKNCSTMPGRDW